MVLGGGGGGGGGLIWGIWVLDVWLRPPIPSNISTPIMAWNASAPIVHTAAFSLSCSTFMLQYSSGGINPGSIGLSAWHCSTVHLSPTMAKSDALDATTPLLFHLSAANRIILHADFSDIYPEMSSSVIFLVEKLFLLVDMCYCLVDKLTS